MWREYKDGQVDDGWRGKDGRARAYERTAERLFHGSEVIQRPSSGRAELSERSSLLEAQVITSVHMEAQSKQPERSGGALRQKWWNSNNLTQP